MKRLTVLAAVFALSAGLLVPGVSAQSQLTVPPEVADHVAAVKGASSVYIVQMADDPVVAYDGGVAGLARTARPVGQRINPNSAAARAYTTFLNGRHDRALAAVGGGTKTYDYTYTFNGFAARITPAQAAELAARPDVVNVWADELRQLTTENSPGFLGLTGPGGLYEQEIFGEDVIVGVIDTGIWPEHPSFSDQIDLADRPGRSGEETRVYDAPPSDWFGTCQSGEKWNRRDCNFKLIGARYFHDGFSNFEINFSGDYLSARDADGHGSHTASTAGGNAEVPATVFGVDRGEISGIAPRARIAAYKACWAGVGCAGSDLVAAIDTAVADGVDVINYSIGGGATTVLTADAISFLFAADVGVYVANSAGNSGPDPSTLGNPAVAPWLTSVGASTQDRNFIGSVELGDLSEFDGGSITAGTGVLPLVDAEDAAIGADPEDVEDAELCLVGSLDPAVVSGNIVLCLRGENARVDKSLAVSEAGGEGMILYNTTNTESINTDNHWVPTVHVNNTDGLAIKTYAATASPTAQITGGVSTTIPAPWMADFSSRGPNPGSSDVIKPDITAPGVSVLAANSPTPFIGAPGELFQSIAGTSMSSPHIAGVFALLREAHPDWSAAVAKSAIMTTADQDVMKEDGVTPADPFDMGGGHVDPNPAVDPGLAYDAGFNEYLGFLCDAAPQAFANPAATCAALEGAEIPTDASDLNLASIAIGELAGFQTVTRTVTNVDDEEATYDVTVDAPAGIDVVVAPEELTVGAGDSVDYDVMFTTTGTAVLDEFAFGSLTWSDGSHSVRSPIAVRPVAIAAPAEVQGSGTEGSLDFDVTFGYEGDYTAEAHGLVPAEMQPDVVVDDPTNDINTALDTGVGVNFHTVTVPAGALHARFSLFDDYTDGNDDLDLFVFDGDGNFVGQSTGVTSEEQVDVPDPAAGDYTVIVHAFQTDGPDAAYTLFSWSFSADAGNMTPTAPPTATLGETETITVAWTGLTAGTKYLGAVSHNDATDRIGVTLVRIDTD
jgi:subtilisin family serine protease/plastocyanin